MTLTIPIGRPILERLARGEAVEVNGACLYAAGGWHLPASSVVRPWMNDIPWKQQTVILCALRGCDGVPKEDPSKPLVRYLRACVLHCADNASGFRSTSPPDYKPFLKNWDHYPAHWLMHFLHAAEVIGHSPCPEADYWAALYQDLCNAFHLSPESADAMHQRLKDVFSPLKEPLK